MNDEEFMNIAIEEGEKALKRGDYPSGCVIVLDNKIISKASSTGITMNDVTAHSEINAISQACKKLKSRFLDDCIIYVNIEPCLMCAQAILYARIKKVVYGVEHKEYGENKTFDILKQNRIGTDIEVISGIKKEKSAELLNKFMKSGIPIY